MSGNSWKMPDGWVEPAPTWWEKGPKRRRILIAVCRTRTFFWRIGFRTQMLVVRIKGAVLRYERNCKGGHWGHNWQSNSSIGVTCQRCGRVCMDGSFFGYDRSCETST